MNVQETVFYSNIHLQAEVFISMSPPVVVLLLDFCLSSETEAPSGFLVYHIIISSAGYKGRTTELQKN